MNEASRSGRAPLVSFANLSQYFRQAGARCQARAARSGPCPRASSRPRGDRRAWRWSPLRAPPRNIEASNYAGALNILRCFEEAKALLRKTIPVARRILGESNNITLRMRCLYAAELYQDPAATLDDIRESVTMLEETGRIAQRVMGGANPLTKGIGEGLRQARAALRAREAPPPTRREFARGWLDGPPSK